MRRFLSSQASEVLSISGRWGVGKTYAWNEILREARSRSAVPRGRYAYVSVFGMRNVEALKSAIFQSTVKLSVGDIRPTLDSFRDHLATIEGVKALTEFGGRKGLNLFRFAVSSLPWGAQASELIVPGAALLIKDQIVCIDDIERAGQELPIGDILGLVSSLREEKNCKIILLLNEEGLGERGSDFRAHLEKVVDQAIRFTPTPFESASAALNLNNPVEHALAERTARLGITNIRVIKRIRRFLSHLEPALSDMHPNVLVETIANLALLGWCVFEPQIAPSLAYVRSKTSFSALLSSEERSAEEVQWEALLSAYGFTHFSDYDDVLLTGLEAGAFDLPAVLEQATELSRHEEKTELMALARAPWEMLGATFDNDEGTFKAALIRSIEEAGSVMSPGEASDVISMLRQIDADADADRLINVYIGQNESRSRDFFQLSNHHVSRELDPAFAYAFDLKLQSIGLDQDPAAILLRIERDGSWNPKDIEFLSSASVEDFVEMFRRTRGDDLRAVLRSALRLGQLDGAGYRLIGDKTKAALEILGQEHRLNALRVRPYIQQPEANPTPE